MSESILWTRHGTGESEWWSLGNYTCRKVNGKWVLKRSSEELGRFEYLQHALNGLVLPMTRFKPERLEPASVSMTTYPDGEYVRYSDIPWICRIYILLKEYVCA